MKLLATLALLLISPALMAGESFPISDVAAYHRVGGDAFLMKTDGTTFYMPANLIEVDIPDMMVRLQDPGDAEFVSTWKDATGTEHTVRTPYDRKKAGEMTRARNHHVQAVRALQAAWGPAG